MIVAIVGVTGNLGRELVREGLRRRLTLRGVAPHADQADFEGQVELFRGSASDTDVLLSAFQGADVVVTVFPASLAHPETYRSEVRNVLDAVKRSGVGRVIGLVGSSGALVSSGERLVDTDYFQETTRHYYQSVHGIWDLYREETELDWVAIVPAARMQTHLRSRGGVYRVRTDERIVTTDPTSRRYFDVSQISYADCACAILDEARDRRFSRQFVSVGY